MKSLLVAGLATVAILPAVCILSLFIYKFYNDFKKKGFEKRGNLVLNREKIGDIFEQKTPSESVRIFKSAICDHSEIDGKRYYTKFPFGLKIVTPHDNHRRAYIAHQIGEKLAEMITLNGDMEFCRDILFGLTECFNEKYYTQLIAWNSLSKLALLHKDTLIEHIGLDYIENCISKDFIAGTGAIKLIFTIIEHIDLDSASKKFINKVILFSLDNASLPLLALFVFKIKNSSFFNKSQKTHFFEKLPNDPKFKSFLDHIDLLSLGFTKQEVSEGLKNLGLESRPYSEKTTEGEIVKFLIRDLLEEIYIPTSYMLHSFDSDDQRQNITDFLWG